MATSRHPVQSNYTTTSSVPMRQDSQSFEQRQKMIWEDMHERMERRRREWDDEVSRLRSDFFRLKPTEDGTTSASSRKAGSGGDNLLEKMDLSNMFYDTSGGDGGAPSGDGAKMFRLSFDVSQFRPEEISITTHDQRLIVHAKHQGKSGDKSVSREFSRQVDIPANIDPQSLRSTLSSDGILQVEAPVAAPSYDRLRDASSSTSPSPGPGRTASPRLYSPAPPALAATVSGQATVPGGSQVFRIAVDIGAEFQPGDLTVKTLDRKLVVHARHEEKAPGRTSCREFNREFDLPDAVDPQSVTASMEPGGRLVIQAPLSGGGGGINL